MGASLEKGGKLAALAPDEATSGAAGLGGGASALATRSRRLLTRWRAHNRDKLDGFAGASCPSFISCWRDRHHRKARTTASGACQCQPGTFAAAASTGGPPPSADSSARVRRAFGPVQSHRATILRFSRRRGVELTARRDAGGAPGARPLRCRARRLTSCNGLLSTVRRRWLTCFGRPGPTVGTALRLGRAAFQLGVYLGCLAGFPGRCARGDLIQDASGVFSVFAV